MKRITVIGILLLLVIGMLAVPSSALTYETYLEDITVNSGTTDIDASVNITGKDNLTGAAWYNISLPCNITNLNATGFVNVTCNCTAALHFNLSINDESIIDDKVVNTSGWYNITSDTSVTAPDPAEPVWNTTRDLLRNLSAYRNNTWLNFTYNSTNGDLNVTVTIYADNVTLSSTWLGNQVVTTEAFLSSPEIEDEQAHSFFAVEDKIGVTNVLGYNLTNVLLNLTYPTQTITEPAANYTISSLVNNTTDYHSVYYSKYGPYVFGAPSEDIDEDDHEVTIKVKSNEVLSNVVDWDFNETAEDYADYFVTIDYDTLEVRLNNVEIDWEQGTIEMEDMTLTETTNIFEFTWTEAALPPVPVVPGPWDWILDDYGTGIALWMWFVITAVVVGVVAVVAYIVRKK